MCTGLLPAYMSVHLRYALPVEARRGIQAPRGLELQMVVSHTYWVLGIDSRSLEELVGLLTLSHLFKLPETAYLIYVVDLLTRNSLQD